MNRHVVYRAFDSYGLLLYIGCTDNIERRSKQHAKGSPWFPYSETLAISEPMEMFAAWDAEREAIETEGAYFNATSADLCQRNASIAAANQAMWEDGLGRWGRGDLEWTAARNRLRAILRDRFPYVTPADRLARYLAAREDAERARVEAAA